jgi:L-serine dehydratase
MTDILKWCDERREPLWRWVEETEGPEIWSHLQTVWVAMQAAIQRGLKTDGILPGGLKLRRKAHEIFQLASNSAANVSRATGLISAYALAVMEENGSAGVVVTAPTCGACGTVPAVLQHMLETVRCSEEEILKALAIAGVVGNLVKTNASISGAEVGCQGEVGTACAMASAAAAYLLGGTPHQCEYAAEMGMEHHLGLTCDPVLGLVQIPCIERNAFAATRAVSAAEYAMFGDGSHRISFDEVIQTMKVTGESLSREYRETSLGGLARVYQLAAHPM